MKRSLKYDGVTATAGKAPDLPPPYFAPLDWKFVRETAEHRIDIGSHTVSNPILTNVDDERLTMELNRSRAVVQDIMQKGEVHFCYPNGSAGNREHADAEAAG